MQGIGHEDENVGTPVAGAHGTMSEPDEGPSDHRLVDPPPGVAPPRRTLLSRKEKPQADLGRKGDDAHNGIDEEHHGHAAHASDEVHRPRHQESRSPGRVPTQALEGGHDVQGSVDREEEHADHGGHGVEVSKKDGRQGEEERQDETRQQGFPVSGRPPEQPWGDPIHGQRL